ncbi:MULTISPECIES: hypothetical protein [unclassified Duganella]|uniref:hypothetical protein n=1 Tax=unclassified Duganella TaxID=2636909 RepID=UPI000880B2CC|nr:MULTISPECIES: hypothetical protein [unclassified Duganella]SDG18195.1 hypothetical protein SAMN05216320_103161 [Duganella sp. OV458]SDJ29811.1 hypothetical protein SAMN05428973_103325 [Duganella sp. OV510]
MQSATALVSMPECLRALAFIGDLVSEQPPDPSLRTMCLGMTIARVAGTQPVPARVIATLAGDLEVLSRTDGIAAALRVVASRHGPSYPASLMDTVRRNARDWLAELDDRTLCRLPVATGERPNEMVSLELMADLIDLQQPWLRVTRAAWRRLQQAPPRRSAWMNKRSSVAIGLAWYTVSGVAPCLARCGMPAAH